MDWRMASGRFSTAYAFVIAGALLIGPGDVAAQTAAPAAPPLAEQRQQALNAQIDRIYASSAYEAPRFGPARWLKEGAAYTTLERNEPLRGTDIVRYDGRSGERSVLVPASRLVPPGGST